MMTDEQRQVMAQFIADDQGDEFDEFEEYAEFICETRDELSRYGGSIWSECGSILDTDGYHYPARICEGVQVSKGKQRLTVYVMDFGDFRGVYQI